MFETALLAIDSHFRRVLDVNQDSIQQPYFKAVVVFAGRCLEESAQNFFRKQFDERFVHYLEPMIDAKNDPELQ